MEAIHMNGLKLCRLMAEKTQKQLGREIGASQALISLIECGRVLPGKSLREAISTVLNKPENEIFPKENDSE